MNPYIAIIGLNLIIYVLIVGCFVLIKENNLLKRHQKEVIDGLVRSLKEEIEQRIALAKQQATMDSQIYTYGDMGGKLDVPHTGIHWILWRGPWDTPIEGGQ